MSKLDDFDASRLANLREQNQILSQTLEGCYRLIAKQQQELESLKEQAARCLPR